MTSDQEIVDELRKAGVQMDDIPAAFTAAKALAEAGES